MSLEKTLAEMSARIAMLEQAQKAGGASVVRGRFKRTAGAITRGDFYVIQSSANRLVDTTTTEGDSGSVVVALEAGVQNGWADVALGGQCWVNFITGLTPSPTDYVITSTTVGKAKAQAAQSSAAFGRLIQWDATNNRGLVALLKESGAGSLKIWYQAAQPTATASMLNLWEETDTGHLWFYSTFTTTWVRLTGFM